MLEPSGLLSAVGRRVCRNGKCGPKDARAELYAIAEYYLAVSKINQNLSGSRQLVVERHDVSGGQCSKLSEPSPG